MSRVKAFLKGEWNSLWNKCRSQGVASQGKLAQAPQMATTGSTKQVDFLAQKYARAGNFIQGQPNILLDPQTSAQAGHFGQTQGKKSA